MAGASQGEGLGNQFLAAHPRDRRHRQRGALLRGRQRHPRGRQVDPIRDIEVIQTELCLADLATVEKTCNLRRARPRATRKPPILVKVSRSASGPARRRRPGAILIDLSKEEGQLKPLCLITAKPVLFVAANVAGRDGFENNPCWT